MFLNVEPVIWMDFILFSVMGTASAWALGLGLSCLLGLLIGFVIRPYVTKRVSISLSFILQSDIVGLPNHCLTEISRQGGLILPPYNKTWKYCLISLGRQALKLCLDTRNAVVRSTVYVCLRRLIFLSLRTLSLMFRIKTVEPQTSRKKPVSLLDCDDLNKNDRERLQVDQLKDLISFDEGIVSSDGANMNSEQKDNANKITDVSTTSNDKVDGLIQAHLMGFVEQPSKTSAAEPLRCSMGLVKRK